MRGRACVRLEDGTTVSTDVDADEPTSAVAERLAMGLRQKGIAATANGDVLTLPQKRARR